MRPGSARPATTLLAICSQFSGSAIYAVCSFALSVVLLRQTGSLWIFAGNTFLAAAATALMGPISGILVDRLGRSSVCLAGLLAAMLAGLLTWLTSQTALTIPATLLFTALAGLVSSCLTVTAVSLPGILSSNRPEMGRLLAGIQIADQSARVLAPLALLIFYPMSVAKVVGVVCTLATLNIMLFLVLRHDLRAVEGAARPEHAASSGRLLHDLRDALRTVTSDRVLRIFAPYLTISTACVELAAIALTPIFLSFGTESQLGLSFGLANAAALLGSVLVMRRRFQSSRQMAMRAFLAIEALGGIFIVIEAQTSSVLIYSTALVCGFLIMPASLVAAQFIWLSAFPAERQGAYAGLERTASWILVPFAYALAPLLSSPVESLHAPGVEPDSLRHLAKLAGLLLLTTSSLAYAVLRKVEVASANAD